MSDFEDNDPLPPEWPAFDDQGHPVKVDMPVVYDEPDQDAPPERDYGKVFSMLIIGTTDAETIRRRVLCWAYLLKAPGGPRTLDELGLALGITRQAAHKWLTRFRAILPHLAREVGFEG